MSDEIRKIEEDERVVDVTSLRALCPRQEQMTFLEKTVLDQAVSFKFERLLHKYMYIGGEESRVFATYITLIENNPALYGNICDRLENFVSEDVIEEALRYIRTGMIPYHFMAEKLVSDLRCSGNGFYLETSKPSMLLVFLLKTMRASLIAYNKVHERLMEDYEKFTDEIKEVIDYAKAWYSDYPQELKEGYMRAFNTESEKQRRKFMDNELTVFSEVLVDMLKAPLDPGAIEAIMQGLAPRYTPIWVVDPFSMLAGGGASGEGEGGVAAGEQSQETEVTPQSTGAGMGSFAEDVLGYGPNGETPQEMKALREKIKQRMAEIENGETEEPVVGFNAPQEVEEPKEEEPDTPVANGNVKYVVKKVAKDSSSRVMSERWFDTAQEAEKFKRDMLEGNPEMARNFEFKIEQGYRGE